LRLKMVAKRANAKPATSISVCPASESKARLPVNNAVVNEAEK
jgi:hypothetical protein